MFRTAFVKRIVEENIKKATKKESLAKLTLLNEEMNNKYAKIVQIVALQGKILVFLAYIAMKSKKM